MTAYTEAMIDARRPQTTGQRGCQSQVRFDKDVVAIHPVPWSHRASACMRPIRVAGLFDVRAGNPTLKAKTMRWPGHHNCRGYEQREPGHLGGPRTSLRLGRKIPL